MIFEQIQELVKEKNTTIAELERQAGLSNGSISKWKTVMPNVASLIAVAEALGVSVVRLIGEKEQT